MYILVICLRFLLNIQYFIISFHTLVTRFLTPTFLLSWFPQPRPTRGRMRIHCLENVDKALQFLKEQRVHLENVGSHDIVDGNHRLTLGLIWTIILRFQVKRITRIKSLTEEKMHTRRINWIIFIIQLIIILFKRTKNMKKQSKVYFGMPRLILIICQGNRMLANVTMLVDKSQGCLISTGII